MADAGHYRQMLVEQVALHGEAFLVELVERVAEATTRGAALDSLRRAGLGSGASGAAAGGRGAAGDVDPGLALPWDELCDLLLREGLLGAVAALLTRRRGEGEESVATHVGHLTGRESSADATGAVNLSLGNHTPAIEAWARAQLKALRDAVEDAEVDGRGTDLGDARLRMQAVRAVVRALLLRMRLNVATQARKALEEMQDEAEEAPFLSTEDEAEHRRVVRLVEQSAMLSGMVSSTSTFGGFSDHEVDELVRKDGEFAAHLAALRSYRADIVDGIDAAEEQRLAAEKAYERRQDRREHGLLRRSTGGDAAGTAALEDNPLKEAKRLRDEKTARIASRRTRLDFLLENVDSELGVLKELRSCVAWEKRAAVGEWFIGNGSLRGSTTRQLTKAWVAREAHAHELHGSLAFGVDDDGDAGASPSGTTFCAQLLAALRWQLADPDERLPETGHSDESREWPSYPVQDRSVPSGIPRLLALFSELPEAVEADEDSSDRFAVEAFRRLGAVDRALCACAYAALELAFADVAKARPFESEEGRHHVVDKLARTVESFRRAAGMTAETTRTVWSLWLLDTAAHPNVAGPQEYQEAVAAWAAEWATRLLTEGNAGLGRRALNAEALRRLLACSQHECAVRLLRVVEPVLPAEDAVLAVEARLAAGLWQEGFAAAHRAATEAADRALEAAPTGGDEAVEASDRAARVVLWRSFRWFCRRGAWTELMALPLSDAEEAALDAFLEDAAARLRGQGEFDAACTLVGARVTVLVKRGHVREAIQAHTAALEEETSPDAPPLSEAAQLSARRRHELVEQYSIAYPASTVKSVAVAAAEVARHEAWAKPLRRAVARPGAGDDNSGAADAGAAPATPGESGDGGHVGGGGGGGGAGAGAAGDVDMDDGADAAADAPRASAQKRPTAVAARRPPTTPGRAPAFASPRKTPASRSRSRGDGGAKRHDTVTPVAAQPSPSRVGYSPGAWSQHRSPLVSPRPLHAANVPAPRVDGDAADASAARTPHSRGGVAASGGSASRRTSARRRDAAAGGAAADADSGAQQLRPPRPESTPEVPAQRRTRRGGRMQFRSPPVPSLYDRFRGQPRAARLGQRPTSRPDAAPPALEDKPASPSGSHDPNADDMVVDAETPAKPASGEASDDSDTASSRVRRGPPRAAKARADRDSGADIAAADKPKDQDEPKERRSQSSRDASSSDAAAAPVRRSRRLAGATAPPPSEPETEVSSARGSTGTRGASTPRDGPRRSTRGKADSKGGLSAGAQWRGDAEEGSSSGAGARRGGLRRSLAVPTVAPTTLRLSTRARTRKAAAAAEGGAATRAAAASARRGLSEADVLPAMPDDLVTPHADPAGDAT